MERDKELREIFSKILNAPFVRKSPYDTKNELTTFTWEEIFNEIGKLQQKANSDVICCKQPEEIPINIC
jgi:hypothetical protein